MPAAPIGQQHHKGTENSFLHLEEQQMFWARRMAEKRCPTTWEGSHPWRITSVPAAQRHFSASQDLTAGQVISLLLVLSYVCFSSFLIMAFIRKQIYCLGHIQLLVKRKKHRKAHFCVKHGTWNIHTLTCVTAGCTQFWNKSSRKEQREVPNFFQSSVQTLWFHLPGEVTATARAGFPLELAKSLPAWPQMLLSLLLGSSVYHRSGRTLLCFSMFSH